MLNTNPKSYHTKQYVNNDLFSIAEHCWHKSHHARRPVQWPSSVHAAGGGRKTLRRQKGRPINAIALKYLAFLAALFPLATVETQKDRHLTKPSQRTQDELRIANISLKFLVFLALRCV